MDMYLVNYACKDGELAWRGKEIVKAQNAPKAVEKFINNWNKEYENEKADIPVSAVNKITVEKICSEEELIL